MLVLMASGCDASKGEKPADPKPTVGTPTTSSSAMASAAKQKKKSAFPPQARRNTAPAAIEKALKAGAMAPQLSDIEATSGKWSLGEKTTVLVFFRGHW